MKPSGYAAVKSAAGGDGHDTDAMLSGLQYEDQALKMRIRGLRLVSRTLTTVLSLGAFVPIALTLKVFLSTRGDFRDALNTSTGLVTRRNAWSKDSKDWPTYLYFGVSATSLLLNLIIMMAYFYSVRMANLAATISTVWEWTVILFNFGFWLFGVIIYRLEKDKNGISNDIWGWTCSSGAQDVQEAFKDLIDFEKMCNVQSSSWYIGLIQVGSLIVTVSVYYFVFTRRRVQRRVQSIRV